MHPADLPTAPPHEAVPIADLGRRMAALIAPLVEGEGFMTTRMPGVEVFTSCQGQPRTPLIYDPCLIVVAQGGKVGYLEDRIIHYGAGNYLIQALPLPFECETLASPEQPLLGVMVRLDRVMLGELARALPATHGDGENPSPMAAVPMSPTMGDNVLRLLECLHDPLLADTLGGGRVREVVFEALRGPQGDSLRRLIRESGKYAQIADALAFLHQHYTQPLTVDALARQVNMSASHFHHHFKHTTRLAPMQYLKRLRLLKARALLGQHQHGVARAANTVGYQSASQFSRDYKRYFGVPPVGERRRPALG